MATKPIGFGAARGVWWRQQGQLTLTIANF
jgi:hypothetical protein